MKLLFPLMKKAKEHNSGNEFSYFIEDYKREIQLIEQNPNLMRIEESLQIEITDETLIKEVLSLEYDEAQYNLHENRNSIVNSHEENEEDEDEDNVLKEIEVIQLTGHTVNWEVRGKEHTSSQILSFPKPSSFHLSTPANLEELQKYLVLDASRSFLYHTNKHWKVDTHELSFFLPTSRAAERMFSFFKEYMQRNKDMRVDVINSFLCLHDLPVKCLVSMWSNYYNEGISHLTSKTLRNSARIAEVDSFCLQELQKKMKDNEKNWEKNKQKKIIASILKRRGIIDKDTYNKRNLEQALGLPDKKTKQKQV